ncbi:MAG: DUF2339 domain-containing protein [Acidobacteria bacterium]|nr:DUF2339 domain-containing protein [Acidobacteriota bacterium]
MKCPNCHETLTGPCLVCPGCGTVFTGETAEKISLYFDVKEQLAYLSTLKNYLDSSLTSLNTSLGRLEKVMTESLDEHPAGEPESAAGPAENHLHPGAENKFTEEIPAESAVRKPEYLSSPSPLSAPPPAAIGENEFHFGQKWLLIIGIITMVFAVGYFLKYSFTKGWVGPTGRVALSYFWGIVFLGMGEWFRKKDFRAFGLSLTGGGIAVLYFATFAGFQLYHLVSFGVSFSLMLVITCFSAVLAIIYDTKWLAALGTLGGFLTPLLLSTHSPNQIALMSYMLILNLGILVLATRKSWRILESIGFVFTWLLYTAWYAPYYKTACFWPSIIFLLLFFLIYAILPVAGTLYRKSTRSISSLWFAAPNALITFGFAFALVTDRFSTPYVSIVTILIAVVFLTLANRLSKDDTPKSSAFWYLVANAVFYLVLTVPILFSSNWITIFWALEAALTIWLGLKTERKWMTATGITLILIVAGKFIFYDYHFVFHLSRSWYFYNILYTKMLPERILTAAAVLTALYKSSRQLHSSAIHARSRWGGILFVAFAATLFITLTIETAAFFHQYVPGARFASISILWAIFASALMVQGFRKENGIMRKTAIAIFIVTLFKVFLVDISHFSTPYRILSFLVLGMLLITSSWLYHHFRKMLTENAEAENRRGKDETV